MVSRTERATGGRRAAQVLVLLPALALAVYLAQAATVQYPRHELSFDPDPHVWRGAYHVHTRLSDGLGTLEQVAAAAHASGTSWVLVADHNVARPGGARYADGVLLVFAPEVGVPSGHVVTMGASRPLTRSERSAPGALSTIRRLGGSPVAAHPFGRRRPYDRPDDEELAGLEILSGDEMFREALRSPLTLGPALLAYPINEEYAAMWLFRPPFTALARWDRLLATRRMPGFCALDAHGRPGYAALMRITGTYVNVGRPRSGNADDDARALVAALVEGRSFCAIDAVAPGGGFRFSARTDAGDALAGDSVSLDGHPELRIDLAYGGGIEAARPRLVCDGHVAPLERTPTGFGQRYTHRVDRRGACRAEVWLHDASGRDELWLLSNPIYVR